jgi:hypothetical protein
LPYSTEPKRWRTGALPFSLRSSEGWLNTEYDWIETPCGALLQKSLLLHGYLAVLLGRERRFFFRVFSARHKYVPREVSPGRLS